MPGVRGLRFCPKHDGLEGGEREASGPSAGAEPAICPSSGSPGHRLEHETQRPSNNGAAKGARNCILVYTFPGTKAGMLGDIFVSSLFFGSECWE